MREIKFRAWNRERKEMYWFNPLWGNTYNQGVGYVGMVPFGEAMAHVGGFMGIDNRIQVDPEGCEIMQYTGLHDKNNKEIYEGDVCRWNLGSSGFSEPFKIVWAMTGFTIYPNTTNQRNECVFANLHSSFEVIGNIYESPELVQP